MQNKPDTHYFKITQDNSVISVPYVMDGHGFAETVKISNLKNIHFSGKRIIGGYEDCLDAVRGSNYIIHDTNFVAGEKTRTFITAKGSIDSFAVINCTFTGKTKWPWDISLGDHTIYDNQDWKTPKMRNVYLADNRRTDGKRIKVLVLHCEKPNTPDQNEDYLFFVIPHFIVRGLFAIKRLLSKLNKK